MKNLNQFTFTLIASILSVYGISQTVTYTNQSTLLGGVSGSSYEDCVVDVDGDGLDDVVRVTDAGLYIDYQQQDGSFDQFFMAANWNNPPTWSLAAGDLNEDGYRDFCFGNGQRVSFVMSSEGGTVWTEQAFPEYIFSQRSSMHDIDNDGDLDAFVCHDVDQSHVYWNDGTGAMELNISGMETHNGPGNYANMWTDFDNDGDTDFYLTKCRQGGSPGQIDVINQMYVNNGDGTFTEDGVGTNTDDQEQSWTTVFEDFDNDGDFDLFTVNHSGQNNLQWNNGDGTFSDNDVFDSGINPYSLGAWELDAHDINNDGFVDIISEMSSALYYNNGDGTFTEGSLGFDDGAFGDLNNDGFLDVVRGNTLLMNNGNDNNYVKINLTGIDSNLDGIGARVEVVSTNATTLETTTQIREVRSGRSFSPMSMLTAHFGIGTDDSIDQITVTWPSGTVTVLDDVEINSSYDIPEAECIAEEIEITSSGVTTICPGETVTLTAPAGGESYLWSAGGEGNSIEVAESGTYNVFMFNEANCVSLSNSIYVEVVTEEVPTISVQGDTFFCEGGSVILTSSDAASYTWSNGGDSQSIEVSESGSFSVMTEGVCYDETSETISVEVLSNSLPQAEDIGAGEGDELTLEGTGTGTLTWYADEDATDLLGTGESFTVPGFTLEQQTSFWVTNTNDYPGELQEGGKAELGNQFGLPSVGGYCLFNVTEDFTFLSASVFASGDGDRTFMLTNAAEEIIEMETFSLVDGQNLVEFNWEVPVGNDWSIRSTENNMFRNDGGVSYPYAIGDVGTIYSSNYGNSYYYYLYDWNVQKASYTCESEPVEVVASIVGVEELSGLSELEIYPNPATDNITVEFSLLTSDKISVDVIDALGKVVLTKQMSAASNVSQTTGFDVTELAPGIYSMRFTGATVEYSKPFVKK